MTISQIAAPDASTLFHVLLAMATVIAAGRALSVVMRAIGQPPVVAEIVAGILLGPSLLGWVSPPAFAFLLPSDIVPSLELFAQFGVILYMFLVGLELNTGLLGERGRAVLAVSISGTLAPFAIGAAIATVLFGRFAGESASPRTFALFLAVSMSVTAFPVLARLLAEHGMSRSPLGSLALASAAASDMLAWCLLALVVGAAQADVSSAMGTIVLALAYVAVMLVVVRPIAARMIARSVDARGDIGQSVVALVFVTLLASALATEWIGIHAIFGAFLLGAVIPHDSRLAREFIEKLQDIVAVLLLPAFFAVTGMRTDIQLVAGWTNVAWCLAIIGLATLGKFAGSAIAARASGIGWREASAIGVLMNTRGLMELIVLNVGLDLGVISPTLFAMLVIMAIVTTMATSPLLAWLAPRTNAAEG